MNSIQATTITVADKKLMIFPLRTSDLLISRESREWDGLRPSPAEYLPWSWTTSTRRGVSCSKVCKSPEEMRRVGEESRAVVDDRLWTDADLLRCKYTRRKSERNSSILIVRNVSRRYWSAVSLRLLPGPLISSKIPDNVWKIVAPVCSSWIELFRIQILVNGIWTTYTLMST